MVANHLNDAEIRRFFVEWLYKKAIKPKHVLNEISIADGAARPDLVALYRHAHCFEIKGDNDQIDRIKRQSEFYHVSFIKNTLITTSKHYEKAMKILPDFWGVIVAEIKSESEIKFIYRRKARNSPYFDKVSASKMLWKQEMEALLFKKGVSFSSKINRYNLVDLIDLNFSSSELEEELSKILLNRKISEHVGDM